MVQTDMYSGLRSEVSIKAPVRVATTAAITLSGLQTIDGVTVVTGDRVLVKNQTTQTDNGIWLSATGAWSRAPDFDGNYDAVNGTMVYVSSGTVNSDSLWRVVATDPLVIGTGTIAFQYATLGTAGRLTGVSFADFGGIADGADTGTEITGTDNRTALQTAVDFCITNQVTLHISGKYTIGPANIEGTGDGTSGYIDFTVPAGKTLRIVGDSPTSSGFLIDEDLDFMDSENGLISLFDTGTSDTGNPDEFGTIEFENIGVWGRARHRFGDGLGPNVIRAEGYDFSLKNCGFFNIRNKITRNKYCRRYVATGNIASVCARGAFRGQESSFVHIAGNYIEDCDDDAIDFHSADENSYGPSRAFLSIEENFLKGSEGITSLGFKAGTVRGNVLFLCHGGQIYLGSNIPPEGATAGFAWTVEGNIIIDPLERYDDNGAAMGTSNANQGAIFLGGTVRASHSTGSVYPGEYDSSAKAFLPWWTDSGTTPEYGAMWAPDIHDEGSDATVYSAPAGAGIVARGNIVMRSLPDTADYWGGVFGSYYTHKTGFITPAVAKANYKAHGLILTGDIHGAVVAENYVRGLPQSGVRFRRSSSAAPTTAFRNIKVRGNILIDLTNGISKENVGGSPSFSDYDDWDVEIDDNVLDLDPLHISSQRTLSTGAPTGAWENYSGTDHSGILFRNCKGWVARRNKFRNVFRPVNQNSTEGGVLEDNLIYCEPASEAYSASNKGVGIPGLAGPERIHVIIDATPGNATYGKVANICPRHSSAIPASGTFVKGHYVVNDAPAASAAGILLGWKRLTTGSGHTLNTDWAEDRPPGVGLTGSATLDPTSLADGAGTTLTITVTGAALGDFVQVAAPYDLQGIVVTAYVSSANTVSVRIQNETTGTIDLASGSWKARVTR